MNTSPLVLVIEDSESIRNALVDCLILAGYQSISAETGLTGFSLALEKEPDIILLDISLPGFNGYEIKKMIDDSPKISGTPVIFVTGHAEREDKIHGFEAGIDDYITKPFDFNELRARVEAVLKRGKHVT